MSKSSSSDSLQLPVSPASQSTEESTTQAAVTSPTKTKKTARLSVANVTSDAESRKNSDVDIPELPENEQKSHQNTHQNTHNSATYNTWYFKSLRHYLTRDVLPAESNYRNLLSIARQNSESRKFSRPTLDELHDENGELHQQLLAKAGKGPKVSISLKIHIFR